jgi:hypothetical protein
VKAEFVSTAAEIVDERVPGDDHLRGGLLRCSRVCPGTLER